MAHSSPKDSINFVPTQHVGTKLIPSLGEGCAFNADILQPHYNILLIACNWGYVHSAGIVPAMKRTNEQEFMQGSG